jgi:two-component system CheB/CheR fusion protein
MEETSSVSRLVVVGASAGGIEALTTLVATCPTPFPAPIVIAQHLEPTHASHLQQILERAGTLPVRTVSDVDVTALENGVVYVVPANRNVEISDHEVRLRGGEGERRPKPSVDLLFSSAAEIFGEELTAVILTGTGSDGADGARVVKEHGGTVIIQNPQTASHPGMPLSLAPTTVDISADVSAIGQILSDILAGTYTGPPPEENQRMRTLLEQLRQRSGIDFSRYRQTTIQRRLQRRMADTGTSGIDSYLDYLHRHPEEYHRLVSTFLIKVTDFFRDPELFDSLRDTILPHIIERARGEDGEIRIWSAGCATGEEPYSIAILLAELLKERISQFHIRIFGTDLDPDAVAFARRGIYPGSSLGSVPPALVDTYFTPIDGAFEVRKFVRTMVVFGQHDLAQRAPFPRTHLVLCRNVLIYFTPELQRRALNLFAYSLQSDGYLVLGKSESTNPLPEFFRLEQSNPRVYRRHGERILITPPSPSASFVDPLSRTPAATAQTDREPAALPAVPPVPQPRSPGEKADFTLLNLPVGVVLMDEHFDVISINLAARRMLGIHGTAIGEDFVHLARLLPSDRLRSMIEAALRGERPTEVFSMRSSSAGSEHERSLEVSSYQQGVETEVDARPTVVMAFTDATTTIQEHERMAAELTRRNEQVKSLSTALNESQETIAQLISSNEELSRRYTLVRSQNEELMVSTEEAQAASEEIETLNEEQQATNEELETLNEELEATVEELNATNEDLSARTLELRDLAGSREAARLRLSVILSSMADATFAVDPESHIVLTNPAFERLFGKNGEALVPEDEDGRPLPREATPQQRAAHGERFTMQFTTNDGDNRRWFEAVGHPISGSNSDAGIVTIRDITDRTLRRLQGQFVAVAAHELRTPLTVLEGSLQMVQRRFDSLTAEQMRQYIGMAMREANRLRTLTEELVDVERLELGQLRLNLEPLDLVEIVTQTVGSLQLLQDKHPIVVEPFAGPLLVSGDSMRLEQVFLNILTNALTHASGTERVDVRFQQTEHHAAIEIQDYGPGIAAEDLPHLFDRFYRGAGSAVSPSRGMGLGLFISREIVVAHGGEIRVRSIVGEGTTFTIQLPLLSDKQESPQQAE